MMCSFHRIHIEADVSDCQRDAKDVIQHKLDGEFTTEEIKAAMITSKCTNLQTVRTLLVKSFAMGQVSYKDYFCRCKSREGSRQGASQLGN